jgi:glycosyltransferase involved in cell wall biosynthesis
MTARIAVIIPSYNRKDLLPETLDSVLNQRCPEGWKFHVVVVDDGSRDGTFEALCAKYSHTPESPNVARLTENLTMIRKENGERGAGRNAGGEWALCNLQPDWMLFFDSDDILGQDTFISLKKRIERGIPDDTVGIYGTMPLWEAGTPFPIPRMPLFPLEGDLSAIILRHTLFSICVTFIPAKVFERSSRFSETRAMSGSEDWNFLIRLLSMGKVVFAPGVLAYYRQHEGNTDCQRFMVSIDLAVDELEPVFDKRKIALLRKQASYLKTGLLNSRGHGYEALAILKKAFLGDYSTWFDPRAYRLGISIAKRLLLAESAITGARS